MAAQWKGDIYFDNLAREILDAALWLLNLSARRHWRRVSREVDPILWTGFRHS